MKVVFDLSADVWISNVEVEAESLPAAKEKLAGMTLSELLEAGYAKDMSLSNVDGVITERDLKVKAYNIQYDDTDFITDSGEPSSRVQELPDEFTTDITIYTHLEACRDSKLISATEIDQKTDEEIREAIKDELDFEVETGIEVVSFDYIIVEEYEW